MKKDTSDLPSNVQAQIRALEELPEEQIDTSDAPEIADWSAAEQGRFYRPGRRRFTLRCDPDVGR